MRTEKNNRRHPLHYRKYFCYITDLLAFLAYGITVTFCSQSYTSIINTTTSRSGGFRPASSTTPPLVLAALMRPFLYKRRLVVSM
jgi:hypothetical protein